IATVKLDRLKNTFSHNGSGTVFLVNEKGQLLAHNDWSRVLKREDYHQVEIVQLLFSQKGEVEAERSQLDDNLPASELCSNHCEPEVVPFRLPGTRSQTRCVKKCFSTGQVSPWR